MAVTVEGAFLIRDRASEALRSIERRANAADRAVEKLGRDLDKVGAKKQLDQMKAVDATMGRLSKSTDSTTKMLDRQSNALDRHRRKTNDNHTALERFGKKMLLVFGGLGKVFGLMKLPAMVIGFASLVPVIAALGAGVVSLLPKLTNLAGVLGALPAAFVGMGLAMGTVKLAFSGLKEAMGGNEEALKKLTPEARRFTETLKSWKPLIDQFRRSAQGGLFAGLDSSLERLRVAAPMINRLLTMMSGKLGGLAQQAAGTFTSRGFLSDFEALGNQGGRIVTRLGQGILNLITALRHVAMAARPFTDWLSRTVLGWTKMAAVSAQAGRETGRLQAYFGRTRATLEQFGRILRNVWGVLQAIGKAASPLGDDLWESAEKATRGWKTFFDSVGGQVATRRFFDSTRDTLRETFGLVGDLSKALARMGAQQGTGANVVHGLRELVPPLERILTVVMTAFGPATITLLNTFAKTVELLGGNMIGPFGLMLRLVNGILTAVNSLVTRVPALGTVIVAAFAVGPLLRAAGAIRGIAAAWGLVEARAGGAAVAEAAASTVGGGGGIIGMLRGGGKGKGFGVPGGLIGPAEKAASVGSRLARAGGLAARGLGKVAWPIFAITAGMDAYGAERSGSVTNRIAQSTSAAISGATLGKFNPYVGEDIEKRHSFNSFLNDAGNVSYGKQWTTTPKAATVAGITIPAGSPVRTDAMRPGLHSAFQSATQINPTTSSALQHQMGDISHVMDLTRSRAKASGVPLTDPSVVAAISTLQKELDLRRGILATMKQTEREDARHRRDVALGSIGKGFDVAAGKVDPKTGKFLDPTRAGRALAASTGELTRQMALDPSTARKTGLAGIKLADDLAKSDPGNAKLKKAAGDAKKAITDEFGKLDIDIKTINGKVLDGSKTKWAQIEAAMKSPAGRIEAAVSADFTAIQESAIKALAAMGVSVPEAKKIVAASEGTGGQVQAGGAPKFNNAQADTSQATAPAKAKGGRLAGLGLRDTIPLGGGQLAAPGELVVNRHTEARINALLRGRTTLGREVASETMPHWAGGGSVAGEQKSGIMPGLATGGRRGAPGGKPKATLDLGGGGPGGPLVKAIRAANAIDAMHYPYAWGGGHGALGRPSPGTLHSSGGPVNLGFDCSGATSAVLGAAGLVSGPMVAASYMNWGTPGYDPNGINTVASPSHVYMMINGRAFGTSGANPGGGAGWFPGGIRSGFKVNHVKNPGPAVMAMTKLKAPTTQLSGLPGAVEFGDSSAYAGGLTAALDRTLKSSSGFETGGRVGWGGWFGNGGTATYDRPTLIGVGDGGKETVTVTKGGGGGGHRFIVQIGKIENHGGNVQREVEAAFHSLARQLAAMGLSDDGDVIE